MNNFEKSRFEHKPEQPKEDIVGEAFHLLNVLKAAAEKAKEDYTHTENYQKVVKEWIVPLEDAINKKDSKKMQAFLDKSRELQEKRAAVAEKKATEAEKKAA